MFSSSLVLADLDYIAPSQACIKPQLVRSGEAAATVYRHTDRDAPVLADTIKISLQDCLACSGCVTSAETMLVGSQSREELTTTLQRLSALKNSPSCPSAILIAVTVSPQSIASIAAHLSVSYSDASDAIARFARRVWSAAVVTDLAWAQAIACRLTAAEYAERVSRAPHRLPLIVSSCPGWVCYCEKQFPELIGNLSSIMSPQGIAGSILKFHAWAAANSIRSEGEVEDDDERQPIRRAFSSPTSSQRQRQQPAVVYHISVQPCFDRKLEAARDERQEAPMTECAKGFERALRTEVEGIMDDTLASSRYTDCVLSTQELLEWMSELDSTFRTWLASSDVPGMDEVTTPSFAAASRAHSDDEHFSDWAEMTGSGGYHRLVLEAVANAAVPLAQYDGERSSNRRNEDETATAPGVAVDNVEITSCSGAATAHDARMFCFSRDAQYEVKRNTNHRIVRTNRDETAAFLLPWVHQQPPPLIQQQQWPQRHLFCVAYGFQHIQNLVRALRKRMTSTTTAPSSSVPLYTFIELMACPSGCLNGGGQIRVAGGAAAQDEMLQRVRLAFSNRFRFRFGDVAATAENSAAIGDDNGNEDEAAVDRNALQRPEADRNLLVGLRQFVNSVWSVPLSAEGGLPAWGTTIFHDRKKDMEELLKANPLHSLKW